MIRAMASLIRSYSAPTFHLYKQKPALSGAERIGKGSRYFLVGPLCAKAETIASNASIAKSLATTSSAFCTSRALMLVAVVAAAATFGVDHAKASKLRSRLRALKLVAVAAAAATFGVDHAKASKLRSRLRALKHVAVAAPTCLGPR